MNLPLQVGAADKRSEDLLKLHTEGKMPGEEGAPDPNQDPGPKPQPTDEDLSKQLKDLQHKFSVLQGKYDAEIEGSDAKANQALKEENAILKRQLTSLQEAQASTETLLKEVRAELDKKEPKPATETPVDINSLLTEEDRKHLKQQDLDDESIAIFMKLAKAAGGNNLENQVQNLSTQVQTMSERVEKNERVVQDRTIDSEVPELKIVNELPEFHAWLDRPVSKFSSHTNRDDLQAAIRDSNFEALKYGVEAFKADTGWKPETKPPKPEQEPDPKKPPKKPPIEPDESLSTDGKPINTEGPKYTRSQVREHHLKATKGAPVDDKWNQISDDMLKAEMEGRIIENQ